MIHHRSRFLIFLLLIIPLIHYGQRTIYKDVFAPANMLVQEAERPYRDNICLNGLWQFQPLWLPAGFKEGIDPAPELAAMQSDAWEKTPIRIPSPWNVNSFANKDNQGGDFRCYPSYPAAWENCKMGWLKKKFTVPAGWKGRRIQLHFEAVAGDVVIMLNGKPAGNHFGIFLPFDLDITDAIMPGKENELCVGIRKASLFDHRSEYGRRTYQAGSFWGQHIAGIWQDVFVVALPAVHVSNVFIQPRVNADTLQAELTITNESATEADLSIAAAAADWKANGAGATALQFPIQTIKIPAHGETKIVLTTAVKGKLKYWSTDNPALYNLVAQVRENGKLTDTKVTRFGWRQVTLQGNRVLLNGKPIIMRGDSWHFLGIPQMTRRYAQAWYQAMRDAKLNAVRLHAQPYPSFYLDVADEMGILVLDETAMWASDGGPKLNDPLYWADSKQHLRELVLRDRNHPSVFGWSVSNEIMPIVRGVMHNPPGMKDTLVKYYGEWAGICRQFDPTRQWISADGEDDGEGHLPVYIVHYGGTDAMDRAQKNGKPWGVGEAGNAYYGTPEQVAETNGNRAYESFLGRMEGVAASSYQSLVAQKQHHAIYQSVFNLVWYGLQPLPLGMKDTTKPPSPDDGVFFSHFQEGQPGVQPERLGPYCTTLNPGYDHSLPLYKTWPLFTAIKDAATDTVVARKWMSVPKNNTTAVAEFFSPSNGGGQGKAIKLLSSANSKLAAALQRTGVLFNDSTNRTPSLLFIDGAAPPAKESKTVIDKTMAAGGTVVVWGVSAAQLSALNRLLPAPLQVTQRTASSLLVASHDDITKGLTNAGLYLSELRPPEFIMQGLNGPLVAQSNILLKAPETDWLKWNKQPEYAKTAMVIRSEREVKPSGVALIEKKMGAGRLLVTTLPAAPRLPRAEKAVRQLLANLGVPLGAGSDVGKPLRKTGDIIRALYAGSFSITSPQEALTQNFVDPASGDAIKSGSTIQGKTWQPFFEESGQLNLVKLPLDGSRSSGVAYLSFWVSSPRDLTDLLQEPNIPVVDMEITTDEAAQVWLNGKSIINSGARGGTQKAEALKLHRGWNHILIKLVQTNGEWRFAGRFTSNQPDFLADLESALEKP